LLKLETLYLDLDLSPLNRELIFSLHVLPGALVPCLQIGVVEDLSAGTINVFDVASDHPDFCKTGRRHGQGRREQNSSEHARDSFRFLIDPRYQIGFAFISSDSTHHYQARIREWIGPTWFRFRVIDSALRFRAGRSAVRL